MCYYTILHYIYRLIDFLPIIDIDICYTFIVLQWTRRISIENYQLITRTRITRTMSRIVQAETREYNLQQTNNPAPSSTSGWSKLDGGDFDDALIFFVLHHFHPLHQQVQYHLMLRIVFLIKCLCNCLIIYLHHVENYSIDFIESVLRDTLT